MANILSRVAVMPLLLASCSAYVPHPSPQIATSTVKAALEARLSRMALDQRFAGAVMVSQDGVTVFEGAFGEADRGFHVPAVMTTRFNVASAGKMFTAIVVAKLAEQGRLRLEDKLVKYLDDRWLDPSIAGSVTIGQLLSHTGGFGNVLAAPEVRGAGERFSAIQDYAPLVRKERLLFPPGSKWSYSNTGFILLGAIIEKITAMNYDEAIASYVTVPAGMRDTALYARDAVVPGTAIGYVPNPAPTAALPGNWRTNSQLVGYRGSSAGGAYSTVADLTRFAQAFQGGELVNDAMVTLMTTPKPNSDKYGYGFVLNEVPDSFGHTGGAPGVSAWLLILPKRKMTVAILSNLGGGASRAAMEAVLEALQIPHRSVLLPAA